MKAVEFEVEDWEHRIWPSLLETYGNSIAITYVCKRKLGFTIRRHKKSVVEGNDDFWTQEKTFIHLDFYDEQKKLMFMLKWCGE
jgi:hypothetical protein